MKVDYLIKNNRKVTNIFSKKKNFKFFLKKQGIQTQRNRLTSIETLHKLCNNAYSMFGSIL